MKRMMLISACAAIALLMAVSPGKADSLNLTAIFTADNFIDNITLTESGKDISLSNASKMTRWDSSSSVATTISLEADKTYTMTWYVRNVSLNESDSAGTINGAATGTNVSANPMAFLGQLSVGGKTVYTNKDSIWSISGGNDGSILHAYGPNDSSQSWNQGPGYHPWSKVLGIGDSAQWIGGAADGQDNDGRFQVKATFKVTSNGDIVATPIPGAVWLLGAGLLGLVGFRMKLSA